ncbi:MAG: antibiotic biosynthesis monooxygenase [Dehalococcoidia bacterium]|nr:antibiotic biosynthesis monooxygenase [Dehalococcoidia bacterium]MSQ16943.1 antibiotic biosynthesis monooxygenase [Dehalococcoidia bacterium]
MFGVVVTNNIKPGFKDQFMRALLDDAKGSATKEPGCPRFDVLQDNSEANRIYLMEEYKDEAAFETHTKQPHFTQFFAAVKDWFATPIEIRKVSAVYPKK